MKKRTAPKWKLFLLLGLVLALLAAAVGGTLAIYTSQVYQRSVVRNRDSEAIRFSSDKLYRQTKKELVKTYYYPCGEDQTTMSFTVCNYDQSKNTVVNEKDIDYLVTFSFPKGTTPFVYKVNKVDADNGSLTLTGTLKGAKRSADTYTIDFGSHPYADTKIAVTVEPKDMTLTKNNILTAILVPIEYATTQGFQVNSEFPDSTRGTPSDFAAYNLSVSVTGGEGTVRLRWDSTKLDLAPFFLDKVKSTMSTEEEKNKLQIQTDPENANYAILTFPMNSEDATGAYLIQFYHIDSNTNTWENWTDLPIGIEVIQQTE